MKIDVFFEVIKFLFFSFFSILFFRFFFNFFCAHKSLCTSTEMTNFDFYVFLYSNKYCVNASFTISMTKNQSRCIKIQRRETSCNTNDVFSRSSRETTEQSEENDELLNTSCIECVRLSRTSYVNSSLC